MTDPKEAALKRRCAKYGITPDQYREMLRLQGGRCKLCQAPPKTQAGKVRLLCIDHDHQTGRVRGIVCYNCNHLLLPRGFDSSAHLLAAAYLASAFDGRKLVVPGDIGCDGRHYQTGHDDNLRGLRADLPAVAVEPRTPEPLPRLSLSRL